MTSNQTMITTDKLTIFRRFCGDIDSWARQSSKKEKAAMNDSAWALIGSLIQDILLVKNGLASHDFSDKLQQRLKESCDGAKTIERLKRFADKL